MVILFLVQSTADFFSGKGRDSVHQDKTPHLPQNYVDIYEDYHGSFKVDQSLDSYGSGVSYSKSAKGLVLWFLTRE